MLMGVPYEPLIYKAVSKVAKVKDVILTDGGCNYFHGVVQIEKETEEDARRAIEAAFQAHGSLKHVIVVDTDIDIYDPKDLEFALATRMRGDEDIVLHAGFEEALSTRAASMGSAQRWEWTLLRGWIGSGSSEGLHHLGLAEI